MILVQAMADLAVKSRLDSDDETLMALCCASSGETLYNAAVLTTSNGLNGAQPLSNVTTAF